MFHACNPLNPGECEGGTIASSTFDDLSRARNSQCKAGHIGPKCSACDREANFALQFDGTCGLCTASEGAAASEE